MKSLKDFAREDVIDVRGCIDAPYDPYTWALKNIYDYFHAVSIGKTPYNSSRASALFTAFAHFVDDENDYTTSVQIAIGLAQQDARDIQQARNDKAAFARIAILTLIKASRFIR